MVAFMVIAAIFSGLIGMNGAVAAMVPVTVIIAVRTGIAKSLFNRQPEICATFAHRPLGQLGAAVLESKRRAA